MKEVGTKDEKNPITMADVTPEIAAKIVKQYILPMFKPTKNKLNTSNNKVNIARTYCK